MKRVSLSDQNCPVAKSLDVIGDWWSLLIIRDALFGARRFGDFRRNIPISKNILTNRLRKLVDDGIFEIAPASDGSAYSEYRLTPKGRGLDAVIVALWQWGSNKANGRARPAMLDRQTGEEIEVVAVRTISGKLVSPGNATSSIKAKPR